MKNSFNYLEFILKINKTLFHHFFIKLVSLGTLDYLICLRGALLYSGFSCVAKVSLHMGSWQDSVLYLIVKYMGEKFKLGNGIMMKIIQIYKLNKVMYIT